MLAEIISIGDEILIGQIINTNAVWISQELNKAGFSVFQITTVSDNEKHIITVLQEAEKRADLIVMTGGLGPTKDDITKGTLCKFFDTKLIFSQEALDNVKKYLSQKGIVLNNYNKDQAMVPENSTIITNEIGTAPIIWFEKNDKVFVSLPGVPAEMKYAMMRKILPRLRQKFNTKKIVHKTILTYGVPESVLAEKLQNWETQLPSQLKFAYLPAPFRVRLRLSIVGKNKDLISRVVKQETKKLEQIIGEYIWGYDDEPIEAIVGKLLLQREKTIAIAESCTGGTISMLMTSIPGSSDYFCGSVIAYSNDVKINTLKVNSDDIENYGAVSEPVVTQMARGVQRLLNTDYAIATSGIAGPTGGTALKPIGTVWIALADKKKVVARKYILKYDRSGNIETASFIALILMRKFILNK